MKEKIGKILELLWKITDNVIQYSKSQQHHMQAATTEREILQAIYKYTIHWDLYIFYKHSWKGVFKTSMETKYWLG